MLHRPSADTRQRRERGIAGPILGHSVAKIFERDAGVDLSEQLRRVQSYLR